MKDNLWNEFDPSHYYKKTPEKYHQHILEQYKMYAEMADRISARRNLANVFFLTLHTTIIGAMGFSFERIELINPRWVVVFPILAFVILCVVWGWLLISYRQLNTAKYKVIGDMEKQLPASPYWSAEWKALGEGKDIKKYLPLTALEKYVPITFGVLYLMIGIFVLFFS